MAPRRRAAGACCLFVALGTAEGSLLLTEDRQSSGLPLNLQERYPRGGDPETGQGIFTLDLPVHLCGGASNPADVFPEHEVQRALQLVKASHFTATALEAQTRSVWEAACRNLTHTAAPPFGPATLRLALDSGPAAFVYTRFGEEASPSNPPLTISVPILSDHANAAQDACRALALSRPECVRLTWTMEQHAEFRRRRVKEGQWWSSQDGQDEWVAEEVYGAFPYNRFFVEVGAADGVLISNSYALERHYNWTGICIEPSRSFEALTQRRSCVAVRAVLDQEEGKRVTFVENGEDKLLGAQGLFSGIAEHLPEFSDYLRQGHDSHRSEWTTRTLRAVLQEEGAPRFIDYLSIDTEGNELRILQAEGLLDDYVFGAISVEHNHEAEKRQGLHDLLLSRGYVWVGVRGVDDLYRHAESWPRQRPPGSGPSHPLDSRVELGEEERKRM